MCTTQLSINKSSSCCIKPSHSSTSIDTDTHSVFSSIELGGSESRSIESGDAGGSSSNDWSDVDVLVDGGLDADAASCFKDYKIGKIINMEYY